MVKVVTLNARIGNFRHKVYPNSLLIELPSWDLFYIVSLVGGKARGLVPGKRLQTQLEHCTSNRSSERASITRIIRRKREREWLKTIRRAGSSNSGSFALEAKVTTTEHLKVFLFNFSLQGLSFLLSSLLFLSPLFFADSSFHRRPSPSYLCPGKGMCDGTF